MRLTILLIATLGLVVLTLLPRWRHEAWWVRSLDFPRFQLSVLALGLLIIAGIMLDPGRVSSWCLFAVIVLCLAYQAWWIIPYTRLHRVEVKAANELDDQRMITIMTVNVLMPNRNASGLLELVYENRPDILVTLESDAWWQARLDTLESRYPFTVKCPQDNKYGMHLYSRLPLQDSTIEYLVEADIPSIHTWVILPNGQRVRAHFLHPTPPSPTENDQSSERDAELLAVAKSVADTEEPTIVTGDLNDVAWSETTRLFRKISGLLDPRIGRGMYNTYHANYWFVRWPLDHLFHSDHFTVHQIQRLRAFGSDHFPLLISLVFEAGRSNEQTSPAPDQEDHALASDKMAQEGLNKNDVPPPGKG